MQITVHRGLNQIGGCIAEIATSSSRVFIDMGENLLGSQEQLTEEQKQALLENLFNANKRTHEAVLYTHGHSDHVGMMSYVPDSVCQYMSQGTKDLLLMKEEVIRKGLDLEKASFQNCDGDNSFKYKEWCKKMESNQLFVDRLNACKTWKRLYAAPQFLHIGDIIVTPLFVSHSVFDAYMFLIEAAGKRILCTGDYRNHGYFGKSLIPVLDKYAGQVDILITEGTMLSRDGKVKSEYVVFQQMKTAMKKFKYVWVLTSATNVERLAAICNAVKSTKQLLVVCSELMYMTLQYFRSVQDKRISKFFDINPYMLSPTKPSAKLIKYMTDRGFVMLVGAGHYERIKDIMQSFNPEETLLIYSAWDGYYKLSKQIEQNSGYSQVRSLFTNIVDIHTSGHADRHTIENVIKKVCPREAIIGIHKEANSTLCSLNLPEELKNKIIPDKLQLDYISVK